MSNTTYDFQAELSKAINSADPKLDRKDLLVDVFKFYTAKLLEYYLHKSGGALQSGSIDQLRRNLIHEFREAPLAEYQQSVEWYEKLFDSTIQEILNDAAYTHQGIDSVSAQENLQINPTAYINEGGLFIPERLRKSGAN